MLPSVWQSGKSVPVNVTVGYAVGNVLASQCLVPGDAATDTVRVDKRLLVLVLREIFPKSSPVLQKSPDEAPALYKILLRAMDADFTRQWPGMWTESKPRPLLDAGKTVEKSWDAFVAKYSGAGELQWTRQLGTNSSDVAYGVSVDS